MRENAKLHYFSFHGEHHCNKHFIPLGPSSGLVKSREGLPNMLPTNIMTTILSIRLKYYKNNDSHFLESLTR
jgi:hypothetical protein